MIAPHQPRLWFTPADIARVRAHIAAGEPTAAGIWALVQPLANAPADEAAAADPSGGGNGLDRRVIANVIAHLVTGEARYAQQAAALLERWSAVWTNGELMRGNWSLYTALAHEACYSAWSNAERAAMTGLLTKLANSYYDVHPEIGDPHDINNNHWAVSHSAAAIAAMAAHGHPGPTGAPLDLREQIEWSRGRMLPFLLHHGDRGLYHEGLGYTCYPGAFWMPMLVAARNFDDTDYLQRVPQLRHLPASLHAASCARPAVPDNPEDESNFGMKLCWNNDSPPWPRSNVNALSFALAPVEQHGELRWLYDHLSGIHADRSFCPLWAGWLFSLFYYPYGIPAQPPGRAVPLHVTDGRQGLAIFRNRYADQNDAVLGCYARVTHVGGHKHDDAGSLRLMALGHDWITNAGQARPKAEWQSIVVAADHQRPENPYGLGAILCDAPHATGGVFGMDLRRASRCYAERFVSVDFSEKCGAPVLLAILDQVDDHLDRDWEWNLTFARELTPELRADRAGFVLRAADGASLCAHFVGVRPHALKLTATPDSERRYQSGFTRTYPGNPIVSATFKHRPHLGVYVIVTVQRGAAPEVVPLADADNGLALRIGPHIWTRPFGAAIPAAFQPGRSGSLCRFPHGRPLD